MNDIRPMIEKLHQIRREMLSKAFTEQQAFPQGTSHAVLIAHGLAWLDAYRIVSKQYHGLRLLKLARNTSPNGVPAQMVTIAVDTDVASFKKELNLP